MERVKHRRYQRSLKKAPIAISRTDHVIVFDNSTEQGYQPVGLIERGNPEWFERPPKWVAARIESVLIWI
jgi:predicted ABC-type ATPase